MIPENIITKAPTAELRENQKDQDSLPPYEVLDDILECLVEREMPISDIIARGHDEATVRRVERLLYLAEYKRRQAAPGREDHRPQFRPRPPLSDHQPVPRSAMTPVVRFAPSPTGRIHVGNLRPALLNWLFARREGGTFLLRFDDTDLERSREDYVEGIREDLRWLGLTWDLEARQSLRFAKYAEAVTTLKAGGRLYPAYDTPDELERRRKRQLARGLPPIYDRAALKLTDEQRAELQAAGRRPHWRFRLEERSVAWNDAIRGEQTIEAASLSDPVLVREDGTYLYTLPSVVDDIDFGITHVIRGEDHVANTGVQIQIFEALGARSARFRTSQSADRSGWPGAVETPWLPVNSLSAGRRS